jgi:hypothetical protein
MLNFKNLNTVTAALSLINGVFYLVFPVFSLMLLGQSAMPIGILNTRVAGACALGMCLITWLSREVTEKQFQRIVIAGNLIMLTILAVIEILGTLVGTLNWIGWLFIAADSLLATGYAFLLKKNRG